ncbi:MAG: hypothetical protein WCD79_07830 [Chthoniobacteraceae bacterium]
MPISLNNPIHGLRMVRLVTIIIAAAAGIPLHASETPSWLVSRVFGGVGGFNLYGIDADACLKPDTGDPYIWTNFDRTAPARWEVRKPGTDGAIDLEDNLQDYSWSRGTGYASLYYRCDGDKPVVLHLTHNGIDSSLRCDGEPVSLSNDPNPPRPPAETKADVQPVTSVTDQGNTLQVIPRKKQGPRLASLPTGPGWHHLLLRLTGQESKGASMIFSTVFSGPEGQPIPGFQTSVNDPEMNAKFHAFAAALTPLVKTDAPFNMVHPGQPLKLIITLAPVAPKIQADSPSPAFTGPPRHFSAVLRILITDYDGKEVGRFQTASTFPDTVLVDLGVAPATGYYGIHLSLATSEGTPIIAYPPDGFSVIGGTAAQIARKEVKKMAVTYYFMAGEDRYKTLFFPYMRRIGIFRNVGGTNGRDTVFYKEAHDQGLYMAADFWNHNNADYVEGYIRETVPFVDTYKSFNEIDISPREKKTADYWVNREKQEYIIAKKYAPNATVLGGSLVRVGNDPWFIECLKLGLDKYQDAWDVHAYPKSPPQLEGSISNAPNESELGLEKALATAGLKNTKPFWLGETGARCSHDPDSRRWQAEMVTKMTAWALSRSDFHVIGFLIPWVYSRENGSLGDIEAGHMPAEAAYYTASALIDGFPYKRLDLGSKIQAAQFGETVLVWSTQDSQPVNIPLSGSGAWVRVDVVGRVSPLSPGDYLKTASIVAGKSPVYLLPRATYERLTAFTPEEKKQP